MGSLLRKDKIGALNESGGNILLNPSILTIGGQQYETTSSINVALPAMAANSRYQVFAIQTAGVVSLVISQNENSSGPAGSDSWKLVGSFMSNGLSSVGFGSFLTIKGAPKSGKILYNLEFDGTAAANMNAQFNRYAFYYRDGSTIHAYVFGRAIAVPDATGTFRQASPTNLTMSDDDGSTSSIGEGIGSVQFNDNGSTNSTGTIGHYTSTATQFQTNQTLSGGTMGTRIVTNSEFDWTTSDSFAGTYTTTINEWSHIPIEDR